MSESRRLGGNQKVKVLLTKFVKQKLSDSEKIFTEIKMHLISVKVFHLMLKQDNTYASKKNSHLQINMTRNETNQLFCSEEVHILIIYK